MVILATEYCYIIMNCTVYDAFHVLEITSHLLEYALTLHAMPLIVPRYCPALHRVHSDAWAALYRPATQLVQLLVVSSVAVVTAVSLAVPFVLFVSFVLFFSAVVTAATSGASFSSPLRNVPGSQAEHFGSPGRLLLPFSQGRHVDDSGIE